MNSKPSKLPQQINLLRNLHRTLESNRIMKASKRELENKLRAEVKILVEEDKEKGKEIQKLQNELDSMNLSGNGKKSEKKNCGRSNENERHKCNECQKSYKNKESLIAYMKLHSGKGLSKCEECGKSFTCRSKLESHNFVHTQEKPFKCDVCQTSFNTAGYLKIHTRIHTGEKPFKCDACDKSFTFRSSMKKHVRKFHEDKFE